MDPEQFFTVENAEICSIISHNNTYEKELILRQ